MTRRSKVLHIIPLLIISISCLFMFINTFSHPPENSYDYPLHREAIRNNQELDQSLPQPLPPRLDYNPPLYYWLFSKMSHLIELIIAVELNPYYFFRIVHLLFLFMLAYLYSFSLVPRLTKKKDLTVWFAFALFLLPNLYLSQVMVRADHLLFLFVHLLFYLWFRFDFHKNLASSWWRILLWSFCLIGMANSRNFAFPAYALFFVWGLWLILPNLLKNRNIQNRRLILVAITATIVFSGFHYAYRYATTGRIFRQSPTPYNIHYYEKQKEFDRSLLFFNFQFDRLYETPNRFAKFRTGNAFLPRLYGDMWADHWLYFSGKEKRIESKKTIKRIVLIYASVFTLLYFLIPIIQSMGVTLSWKNKKPLNWTSTAALLFTSAFILFILFLYDYSEVGKNSSIKFSYLLGYSWFPFFCLLGVLKDSPKIRKVFLIYTITLYAACIPLYIYILRI